MARASVLLAWAFAVGCTGGAARHLDGAALGWSLGGEAHVFVTGDRFAARLYTDLTRHDARLLRDSLAVRRLVAVSAALERRAATVLSASGVAPAALTLVRFHAPGACGRAEIVTELVLAFTPAAPRRAAPPHAPVVAVLAPPAAADIAARAAAPSPALPQARAIALVERVAQAAERLHTGRRRAAPLAAIALHPDRAADAGEVVPLAARGASPRYAVGFRVRFGAAGALGDTALVTGVAETDTAAADLRWIVRPIRARLTGGMLSPRGRRYSLRGVITGLGGGGASLLLVHEIADVAARDSRATAVRVGDRRVVAAQPLALRCP